MTDDSIRVATFSDRGFAGRPGLNQELFDSGEVFTKWCNDAGGINGRQLILDERDAALTEYKARIVDSCQQDFFMVGGGAVFDDTGVKDRLECMLPDVAGFVVTPTARASDLLVQPLPNPPGALMVGDLKWFAEKFPESTQHVGILTADVPTTVKVANDDREAVESMDWKVVYSDKYPAAGAVSWTPYVQALKDKGVRAILWTGEPEGLAKLEQAMADANYSVDWIRTPPNHNDQNLIDVGGAALKNTYIWSSFAPFEAAAETPAIQQYLDHFGKYAPDAKTKAYLGLQSWSAWLLFAQASSRLRLGAHSHLRVREAAGGPRVDRWRAARAHRPGEEHRERMLHHPQGHATGLQPGGREPERRHLQLQPEERLLREGRGRPGHQALRRRQDDAGPEVALPHRGRHGTVSGSGSDRDGR